MLVIYEDRRVDLVPIPRIVGMILMVALDVPGCGVERDRRRREKIVARSLVSHPWTAITGAPECEVSQWIIVTGDPHRPTTGLPLISVWPSLAAGFTGTRYGIGLP